MNIASLVNTNRILLLNWFIAPALAIWIWIKVSFLTAFIFVALWLILDKVWDRFTDVFINKIEDASIVKKQALRTDVTGELPTILAFAMTFDLSITFLLPWFIAGFFLGWFV